METKDHRPKIQYFKNHRLIEGDYTLNQVEMGETLASSGNSPVYRATVKSEVRAVKQITIKTEDQRAQFAKQLQLIKQLSKESKLIIKYYGYFRTYLLGGIGRTEYAYIVMEKGITSLDSIVQHRHKQGLRFSTTELCQLIKVLISAFGFLQKKSIAHCDIKPENMIVMDIDQLEVKICDIGSGRVAKESTEQGTLVGTVPFLAPQLVKSYRTDSISRVVNNPFKSDAFSFGLCLLYIIRFQKYCSNDRMQTDELVYKQVIGQWIKEAKECHLYNKIISDVLDASLEFDEKRRSDFLQLQEVLRKAEEELEKQKIERQNAIKKLREDQNKAVVELYQSANSKVNIFETTQDNLTKTHNGSIENAKDLEKSTTRNQFRAKLLPRRLNIPKPQPSKFNILQPQSNPIKSKQVPRHANSNSRSKDTTTRYNKPLLPKLSMGATSSSAATHCTSFFKRDSLPSPLMTQVESPTRVRSVLSTAQFGNKEIITLDLQQYNQLLDSSIVATQIWEGKLITLSTTAFWSSNNSQYNSLSGSPTHSGNLSFSSSGGPLSLDGAKSLCFIMQKHFDLVDCMININRISSLKSLAINFNNFVLDEDLKNGELPEVSQLMDLKTISLIMRNSKLPYTDIGTLFLRKQIKKAIINVDRAPISSKDLIHIVQRIILSDAQNVKISLKNLPKVTAISEKETKVITDLLSKSRAEKLFLDFSYNDIVHVKESPWHLPSNINSFTLCYRGNKLGGTLNSLSSQLPKIALKQLNLNLSDCNLSTREINVMFSFLSKTEIDTIVLDLSQNKIGDSCIKYICTVVPLLIKTSVFKLDIHNTEVTPEGWRGLMKVIDKLFKCKMNHMAVSYNRFARKDELLQEVRNCIRTEVSVRTDLLHYGNWSFQVNVRRKPTTLNRNIREKGFCSRLHSCGPSSQVYVCLTCKDEKEMYKYYRLCEYCVIHCHHKHHHVMRVYEPAYCICAFSGQCKSQINMTLCKSLYGQSHEGKIYECLKCELVNICLGCIRSCKSEHSAWVRQSKDIAWFKCKNSKGSPS